MNTELATTSYNQSLAKDIGMGAVRSALMRLLRSQDLVGWSSREESGRLDRRSFKRMAAGEESLFSRRQYKEAEKSAVSIMVDCSGSMSGTGIEPAQDVSIHLGQLLDKARVSFACHGFRSTSTMDASVTAEEYLIIPFKPWGLSLRKSSARLGAMKFMANYGTPDYAALYWAVEDLSRRPESRRILFVITDARGYEIDKMKIIRDFAERHKIKLIAVGINADSRLDQIFPVSINIASAKALGDAAFRTLLNGVKL